MTRVVLISGKGGVGKTTIAAATGVHAATRGVRTLVTSLDRAHNLGDVLATRLGPEAQPVPETQGLWALEASPQAELRRQWDTLSGYFSRLLAWAGVDGLEADEIAVFPGLEELLVLSRLTEIVESTSYELVVVDLAPTASSLRLLSFPDLMAGPFGRLVRWERSFMRIARPAGRRLTSMPLPADDLYESVEAIARRLSRLRELLTDPARTAVRLVSIPERVVVDETRAAFTLLSLFGLNVDAVILNRVFPKSVGEGYLHAWTRIQAREAARAREFFADAPVLELRFQPDEVIGSKALSAVARELFGDRDPTRPFVERSPLQFRTRSGATVLEIRLPNATECGVDLKQHGDHLILTVGGWRRRLALPASLRGRSVRSARFADGLLRVQFESPKESAR